MDTLQETTCFGLQRGYPTGPIPKGHPLPTMILDPLSLLVFSPADAIKYATTNNFSVLKKLEIFDHQTTSPDKFDHLAGFKIDFVLFKIIKMVIF